MSLDQRRILEILLNLFKIESRYKDSISDISTYMYKPSTKGGKKRTFKEYVNLEEYDEELSNSDQ